jgi:hypothetical protein
MLDSALLDSAALCSCFFTGVDWEVRPAGAGVAGLTFSGAASPASRCSLGAKHGRQARSPPPDRFDLLLVEPSRCAVAGASGGCVVFSLVAARRLLLAVLPARRLPMMLRLECFDPRPMLSVSAAVAPLNPVPEAVPSAFCCELP